MDSITDIEAAVIRVVSWLADSGCTPATSILAVQAYHSELAELDKRAIPAEFVKADSVWQNSSRHRIVVATDAMGMGIDNPDIRIVVQWKLPSSMCSLLQQAGRASRSPNVSGQFIWLVESWCYEEDDATQQQSSTSESLGQLSQAPTLDRALDTSLPVSPRPPEQEKPRRLSQKAKKDAERRSRLPDGFWQLINGRLCIRKAILQFFGEDISQHQQLRACCSRCSVIDIPQPPATKKTLSNVKSTPWMAAAAREALLTW